MFPRSALQAGPLKRYPKRFGIPFQFCREDRPRFIWLGLECKNAREADPRVERGQLKLLTSTCGWDGADGFDDKSESLRSLCASFFVRDLCVAKKI